jgi:hypothetical protein
LFGDDSRKFLTFSVDLPMLGRLEYSSFSTDTRPSLKHEFHLKTAVFKSLMKHFKGFDSGFTELHAKLDADTLIDFAICHTQNETRSRKSTGVKRHARSQRGVTWQTDTIGFRKCDLSLSSHLLSPRQLQQ